ncbi:MAG: winged helix-turn-helix transcriptional regulator [Candidatus Lokiarchaeota archaeon]|nr:winged helix-turn-helix transcriptional regulator [Candidatus Lokiarchaeota archaeon]
MFDTESVAFLKNKISLGIILRLLMFQELSFTELSKALKKSKSTIHRNVQDLMKSGLIHISKEVKVRGSIKAKYYKISEDFINFLALKNEDSFSIIKNEIIDDIKLESYMNKIKTKIAIVKNPLEGLNNYVNNLHDKATLDNSQSIYNEIQNNIEPNISTMLLSRAQFKQLIEHIKEFYKNLKIITKEVKNNENTTEKPYIFSMFFFKIKEVLESI